MLPEGDLAERDLLLPILLPLLHYQQTVLLSLGQPLLRLGLLLIPQRCREVLTRPAQLLLQLRVSRTLSRRLFHDADVISGARNLEVRVGHLHTRELDTTSGSVEGPERRLHPTLRRVKAPNQLIVQLVVTGNTRPTGQPDRLAAEDVSAGRCSSCPAGAALQAQRAGAVAGEAVDELVAEAESGRGLVVVQVADVDDDDADEDLEGDAGDQHRQHEAVETVTLAAKVEQQLQLRDLRQRKDGDEGALGLDLRLLELAVTREQLKNGKTIQTVLENKMKGRKKDKWKKGTGMEERNE